ncbi:MAG: type 2 isopentenyl-diphosphate Delta-isomerase [Candidatus Saccharibacteria bacterium]|nr:type 2 isopentenyl-diphosphate Delta-isomerase [Candidatus Saccharibacteria bacterium]
MSQEDSIASRKGEHIKWCLDPHSQGLVEPFSNIIVPYKSLPEIDMHQVDTSVKLFGKQLSQPLIISSMTGGTKHGIDINTNLAKAAESEKIAIGVGSQRIALEKPAAVETFKVIRKYAPTAFVFANMGAVQLNYGYTAKEYQKVIDMIQADALYLHINPLQEAVQPEGDTDWRGLIDKIAEVVKRVDVPVVVKEVGHGIDTETAKALLQVGVSGLDVAGVSGTSYAWVEAKRARNQDFANWFKDIGIKTEDAINQLASIKSERTILIASGGLRSPVQGYKAKMCGADFYASTQPFLDAALKNSEEVVREIQNWQKGLQITQFVSGKKTWESISS